MNRLTHKNMVFMLARNSGKTLFDQIYRKLYKLEDIEEQLGCPLDVYFKWLSASYIYAVSEARGTFERFTNYTLNEMFNNSEMSFQVIDDVYDDDYGGGAVFMELRLKDYKKTWWLKEDKTE